MPRAEIWDQQHGHKMVVIFCPGCQCDHSMPIRGQCLPGPSWIFNGDLEKPTLMPSIHVSHDRPDGTKQTDCHSFVTAGRIQFLDDSAAHKLRGWHDLPEID